MQALAMPISDITGHQVRNTIGENLGDIKDVMIDTGEGRIAYAVLSFGGVLGIGDKLFAVPWQALTLNRQDGVFLLDVDKERLENAPGFDKDNWPAAEDRTFIADVHAYYNIDPYWERL